MVSIPDFLVSVGCLGVTLMGTTLARLGINSLEIIGGKKGSLQRVAAHEFISTFELCAVCFELGIIMQHQGFHVYTLVMLFIVNYYGRVWGSATASPAAQVLNVLGGRSGLKQAILNTMAQVCGGFVAFPLLVRPIWSLGLQQMHTDRLLQSQCFTHLQVPPLTGAAIEALLSFTFLVMVQFISKQKYTFISVPLLIVSLVYTGISFTGGYFSPVLASTIQLGCKGITLSDHLLVYWLGPISGAVAYHLLFSSRINKKLD